ncbi:MAG: glycosyltransferase family 2 protein [Candidatus Cloacimonetes bacterium]|nr:glycosyltransferase family 2 protein [Candidatus Cloacimonadota bacterium]MDY0173498.1 glycosyltransferase family 2 protein [Candidatus Cloacimonadaceae bacterium]
MKQLADANKDIFVSIIIPLYNKAELTARCLETLFSHTPEGRYELVLVDNASTDRTSEVLDIMPPVVRVIRNSENIGFAGACNQGAKVARGEYLLFLNNDTELLSGWLEPLLHTMASDPAIAAVGSKLLFPDGTIQHAGVVIVDNRITNDPLCGEHIWRGKLADTPEANRQRDYKALTAACLLVRRQDFWTVGGFDEGYWNGYEDVDLCFKLLHQGKRLVYEPRSVLIHHESKSGSERFRRAQDNIRRLHDRWLGKIHPDIRINPDNSYEWLDRSVPTGGFR